MIDRLYRSLLNLIGGRDRRRQYRESLTIAFDVDGTLIDEDSRPIYRTVDLLRHFVEDGHDVIIWSGGGIEYAETFARKLGFEDLVRVVAKGSEPVDIAFDDEAVELGIINYEV